MCCLHKMPAKPYWLAAFCVGRVCFDCLAIEHISISKTEWALCSTSSTRFVTGNTNTLNVGTSHTVDHMNEEIQDKLVPSYTTWLRMADLLIHIYLSKSNGLGPWSFMNVF